MRNSTTEEPGNELDVKDKQDEEQDEQEDEEKTEKNKENSEKKSPGKMGDKSPQKQPKQRTGKGFTFEVVLLDGEHVNIELDKNAEGRELFDKVCQHLDLIEKEYFGLQYVDERLPHHLKCWLSPDKKISKQKKRGPWLFDFALKFYPPDPTQLRESLTRWLVTLQTRRDVLSGKLPATFLTQAMLGSYCVQADVGDFDPNEHHGIEYVKDIPFAPNQTTELLEKIVELHRQYKGQTPDEAEINFLENAKKLSMYGVDLHAAQDVNNVDIMLGVCSSGLQVYREKLRISRFVWPKILKISYKRRHFYIKVRPADNHQMENAVAFKLASHRLAKRLWKICVEHHAFFRLREAEQAQNSAMFPRLGSKFRYSGRTLYQARHNSQILDRPDPYFERSQPARSTYAAPTSRSLSVDELTHRPDWKDDMDVDIKRRPSEGQDGRDRRDHMGKPTPLSQIGLPEGMKPVQNEEGNALEPGANQSMDGKDRRDNKPGEDDALLRREGGPEDSMGLTPAELQKKAKEDEKERKKREKEEKRRKKEEEDERKKAEKLAAKKGKGKDKDPTSEDRRHHLGAGDNTENAPGRTPGSYGDQEGEPRRLEIAAPLGSSAPGDKARDKDNDQRGPGQDGPDGDRWSPGRHGSDPDRDRWGPGSGRDGRDQFAPGKDGEKGRWSPGRDGVGKDKDRWGPGRGDRSPDGDKDRFGRDGERSPGTEGEDRRRFAPGEDGAEGERVHWGPGLARVGSGRDEKDPKKGRKDSDKDEKDPKKGRKDSDKDEKDPKKGKKGSKDKDRKGSEKDDEKDKQRKGSEKDEDKDKKDKKKDGGKDKEKKGGLFGKSKKPKDSKSKLAAEDAGSHPGDQELVPGAGGHPDTPDAAKEKKGSAYPGYGPGFAPGMGVGAGDMTGVVGDETWIDNKLTFEPIVPAKKENKDSLKGGLDGIDHTMPFFSPAATSTVGRPGKVPPPVPPKMNSSFGADDSFSKTDVYKTEKDGIQETRVEHKVVLASTDDDFDYDAALAEAIRSVTEFNPDMSVERIECVQQIEDVKDK